MTTPKKPLSFHEQHVAHMNHLGKTPERIAQVNKAYAAALLVKQSRAQYPLSKRASVGTGPTSSGSGGSGLYRPPIDRSAKINPNVKLDASQVRDIRTGGQVGLTGVRLRVPSLGTNASGPYLTPKSPQKPTPGPAPTPPRK